MARFYRYILFRVISFWVQLCYFISVSFLGFVVLKVLKLRTDSFRPKSIDMFFMSVSAVTVSSMSTVEMEVFSNTQLMVMTILMLLGGEVFTSLLGLQFAKAKLKKHKSNVDSVSVNTFPMNDVDHIELGIVPSYIDVMESNHEIDSISSEDGLKYNSTRYLGYIVLGYLLLVLVCGTTMVMVYLGLVTSASEVLKRKGLQMHTFSVFTIVSTFSNCGFIPTNENMIVFKNNPGLLFILVPQVLLGNTLYPSCLRGVIWVLGRLKKRDEFKYLLENSREVCYPHLLPRLHSLYLAGTVVAFILVQFVVFCCMEWNSGVLDGMNLYEKVVGALFMTVNSRHAGESIIDLSTISSAVLVLFVLMMYLHPYTSFFPIKEEEEEESIRSSKKRKKQGGLLEHILFSQLSYLVIFVIAICIMERKHIKQDPLNFTVLNIVIEVISAYGNVGFSAGYSCKRQINPDGYCKDTWYGFSGRWSNEGKLILILVMFFGRLKNFNMDGGKTWKVFGYGNVGFRIAYSCKRKINQDGFPGDGATTES